MHMCHVRHVYLVSTPGTDLVDLASTNEKLVRESALLSVKLTYLRQAEVHSAYRPGSTAAIAILVAQLLGHELLGFQYPGEGTQ